MTHCKNCANDFEGKYCNECGQSAHVHPLNFHFLWHDIQHGLLHFDKGVPYTLKALFTRPGHALRDYIQGKRAKFYKPISLLILLASLYTVLSLYFHVKMPAMEFSDDPRQLAFQARLTDWMEKHYVAAMLITLPFWSIGSFIAFFKQRYNLVEHFVLNAYIACQMLTVQLLLFPITLYYQNSPNRSILITVANLIYLVIVAWTYSQFFDRVTRIRSILNTLLAYAIMSIGIAIPIIVIQVILMVFKL